MTELIKLTDHDEIKQFVKNNKNLFPKVIFDDKYSGKKEIKVFSDTCINYSPTAESNLKILNDYLKDIEYFIIILQKSYDRTILTIGSKELYDKYNVLVELLKMELNNQDLEPVPSYLVPVNGTIVKRDNNYYLQYEFEEYFESEYNFYLHELEEKKRKNIRRKELYQKRKKEKETFVSNENSNNCSVCLDNKLCNKFFSCSHNNLCCDCFLKLREIKNICPLCRSN